MNPSGVRRTQYPLLFAAFFGVLTVAFAAAGLVLSGKLPPLPWGLVDLLFYSVAILAFEQPAFIEEAPGPLWSAARLGAFAFSISTGTAVIFELEGMIRFAWMRVINGTRQPAILLGLGWIGAPISATLRRAGRPVWAAATDEGSALVTEARRNGILVVIGDATDARTRSRLPIPRAREVFVATGDDALNVELAGDLIDASPRWRRRSAPLQCYVHITDPTFAETLGWQQIWSFSDDNIQLVPFSYQELAARDLFFGPRGIVEHPALRPRGKEPFHLVVVGFGHMGQTVARYAARFAHFGSLIRPRVTVLDRDDAAFEAFLQRYPAFSPQGLDLEGLRSPGSDDWSVALGRPEGRRHRVEGDAVEYAVHAELLKLPGDLAAETLSGQILGRAAPLDDGTPVHLAVVVCLEEDRASFEAALRIQHALASAVHDWPDDQRPGQIPVFVHLPEQGLATVLDRTDDQDWLSEQHQDRDRAFPVRAFGIREVVASWERVTARREHQQADRAQELYQLLAPMRAHDHVDFPTSNLDAALHAQVKAAAVGISLFDAGPRGARLPSGAVRVLPALFTADVDKQVARLVRRHGGAVPREVLQDQAPPVQQRLVLEGRVITAGDPALVHGILDRVIADFEAELAEHGVEPKLPAMMEHHRWMGERLLKGWRFGERDDLRRQRASMIPWSELSDDNRRHDGVSLPRFIVEAHKAQVVAHW